MDKPTCATCPYFVRDEHDPRSGLGTCHRHAPRPRSGFYQWNEDGSDCEETYGYFASIAFFDWCGEHPDFPKWIEEQRAADPKPVVFVGFPEDFELARKLLAQHGLNVPPQDCTTPPE